MKHKYLCKICKCPVDPGENFLCDDCMKEMSDRSKESERVRIMLREAQGGQYEFSMRRKQA